MLHRPSSCCQEVGKGSVSRTQPTSPPPPRPAQAPDHSRAFNKAHCTCVPTAQAPPIKTCLQHAHWGQHTRGLMFHTTAHPTPSLGSYHHPLPTQTHGLRHSNASNQATSNTTQHGSNIQHNTATHLAAPSSLAMQPARCAADQRCDLRGTGDPGVTRTPAAP